MMDSSSFQPLDWPRVARARAGTRIGRHVVYRATVASTNLLARALARDGAPDGTVVLADEQTEGRGRHGRRWMAPPRSGLAVSVLLRLPDGFPLHTLTMVAALAAGDAVRAVVGDACTLKWPNDVQVDEAKVGGILLELDAVEGGWIVVVGIGLNVNAAPALPGATDLAHAVGAPVAREPLLMDLLAALDRYLALAVSDPERIAGLWRDRLTTLGRRVRVGAFGSDATLEGLAIDVDAEGALLVRLDDGTVHPVRAGDVTLAAHPPQ